MAKISQNTIDLIKNTADIVDVVGEFVSLQPAGKNMKGLCPFHSEKTPSFFVSKERQIFNCFGCGEKGNAITFIQRYKNLSFIESLKYLADKYHIDIEFDDDKTEYNSALNLYKANERATKFYQLNLQNMNSGKEALDYLIKRGLDLPTIEEFELGFAPNSSTALYTQLKDDYQPLDLLNAGLINKGQDDYYDLFRSRIMFPIRDELNRVVAFSGRIFGDNDNPAKYINTAQTEIFAKGFILYNLNRAIPHIRKNNRVVLMEGQMDVIKASKALVKETVCSMGTQLTIDQALKLRKYTENVIICYDGDRAGKEATYKAIKLLEQAKMNVRVVMLPDGMDPDEYISDNPNFNEYLDTHQIDQYEFVYKMLTNDIDLSKPGDIEAAKNKIFDFFKKTSGTIRDIYFNKFAQDFDVEISTLTFDYNQTVIDDRATKSIKNTVILNKTFFKNSPKYKKAEIAIINYYLRSPEYRTAVDNAGDNIYFQDLDNRSIIFTAKDVNKSYSKGNFLVAIKSSLIESMRNKLDQIRFDDDYEYSNEDFQSCMKTLQEAKINDDITDLVERSKQAKIDGNEKEQLRINQEIINLRIKQNKLKN